MFLESKRQAAGLSEFHTFEEFESNVRSYCRDFPVLMHTASGSIITGSNNSSYIDFFMGAGALNYGHNSAPLKKKLIDYIAGDGIAHSLDFYTQAKEQFIQAFQDIILKPRALDYKLHFTGPTGTNAVEAALKLARKVTKRTNVIAFTNAFHGMSLGSLAVTASPEKRQASGVALGDVTFMPYQGYLGEQIDTLDYIARMLEQGSGIDAPAAFIIETIQGEGGLQYLTADWLRRLQALARKIGALLIVDDIQSGCGRSGTFFSFEAMDVYPDIVCMSKSLSGYGLPFSINLIKPEHDIWKAGEHNGTFRGNNLAFVTASAALAEFWVTDEFEKSLSEKIVFLHDRLATSVERIRARVPQARLVGRGFMCGISFSDGRIAQKVSSEAFRSGLIVETCGVNSQVIKLLPALTIERDVLAEGLDRLDAAIESALRQLAHADIHAV